MISESNHKVTLRSRPDGYPKLSDFELVEEQIPQPRRGRGANPISLAVSRPLHARTNERRRVLCAFRAARRSDGWRRSRAHHRISYPCLQHKRDCRR